MKTKIALSLIVIALIAGCSSVPTWDTGVFPNQAVYSASPQAQTVADLPK